MSRDTDPSPSAKRRTAIVTAPVGKQLVILTLPLLIALVAIMGLGLVDSYFISYLGTSELAAIGFIAPVTQVSVSIALGIGMGISALVSRLIGGDKLIESKGLITDGLILAFIVGLIVAVINALFFESLFTQLGATTTVLPYIKQYFYIWLLGLPLLIISQVGASIFRAIGDIKSSAIIALSMTLTNIILDPLLIFGIGPFPRMEMQGAALATVISVILAAGIGFYKLGLKEHLIRYSLPTLNQFMANLRSIGNIAIPATISNVIVPVSAALLTMIVATQGVKAVAGYGVGIRIEAFSYIMIYALSGVLPMFIGQNMGANKPERAYQAIKLSFQYTLLFQFIVYIMLCVVAAPLASQFSELEDVQQVIRLFIYIVPLAYSFGGIVILVNVSMNVLQHPRQALMINLVRLFCLYLPLALLGLQLDGLRGIFIAIAASNLLACLLAIVLLRRVLQQQKIISTSPLDQGL